MWKIKKLKNEYIILMQHHFIR